MEIFLIRHAEAVPRRPELDDANRPLTPRGHKRWARGVRGLGQLGQRFDRLYHSPAVRAIETANAIFPLLDGESLVSTRLCGKPDMHLLEELKGKHVAVVGHEPWLSELVALLLLGEPEQGPKFALGKGGVAWLSGELRPARMTLQAFLPPKALRKMGR